MSLILSEYGKKEFHREIHRVHLDILKLSDGNLERLKSEVDGACDDYRDTMLSAEYPQYAKKMFRIDRLPPVEQKRITDADRDQYEAWLRRPNPTSEPDEGGNSE